ncbi:Blue-light-activated protein [Rosistilla ulvae]|uniref:histidine kinase n=1 Tax=Rosistilla ulvae TaxID=1930277 RepID=A0A517LTE3_9BACT|nr:CHASE3 domain-containing protein [Rosistilla ulvae]QDS85886.1 Blue-light-activated protein [Rosistilla ulvae]
MSRTKRNYWLTLAIIASFIAVAVFGIVTFRNTFAVREVEQRIAKSHAVREATHQLLSSVKDMQTGQRGYLLTGNPIYLDPYRIGVEQIQAGFARLRDLTADNPIQLKHLDEMQQLVEEKHEYLAHTIQLRSEAPNEPIGDQVIEIVKSGEGEGTMEKLRDVAKQILTHEGELLQQREAASEHDAEVSRTAIMAGHAIALGLIVIAGFVAHVDRKKRDSAETRLDAKQSELAAVINSANDGIIAFNRDLGIRLTNPAAAAMWGIDSATSVGQSLLNFVPHQRREAFRQRVQDFLESSEASMPFTDGVGLRSNGEEFPCQGEITKTRSGEEDFLTLILADVSQSRDLNAKLRQHTLILDQVRDAVLVCDKDDQILSWNEGAHRLYGLSKSEALGKNAAQLLFPDDRPLWDAGRDATLAAGDYSAEFTQRTADGRQRIVEQRRSLLRNEQGEPTAQLILSIDVSDRKREEAKERRSQRLESIGTLAGGVAHDLNNVLTPILMSGKLLKQGSPNASRLHDTIVTSAQRGAQMIQKLLAFAGGDQVQREEVDLREILSELEEILSHTLQKTIDLQISIPDKLDLIHADSTELSQVLMNLAINARDAMPGGGRLDIQVENFYVDPSRASHSDNLNAGPHVLLTVADSGEGIPKEVIERIFDPFFTTKAQGKGTGLGLATTLGIVRSFGGDVTVYSEPLAGTIFSVYLPSSKLTQPKVPAARIENHQPPRGNGELILIVDDESLIVETSCETLQSNRYRTVAARSGAEAVAVFQNRGDEIDCVLLDMMMPGMDGLDTKDALRELNPNVRVIASSGLRRPGSSGGRLVDVDGFLPKPYTDEQLLNMLRNVLDA